MIVKVFKIVWIVSLFTMMGTFIYCYASWPVDVALDVSLQTTINKEVLFYLILGLAAVFNSLIYIISRLKISSMFISWYYGMVISLHIFLISIFIFITIFNSFEKYDYTMVAPILYASIFILMGWIIAWPIVYILSKRKTEPLLAQEN